MLGALDVVQSSNRMRATTERQPACGGGALPRPPAAQRDVPGRARPPRRPGRGGGGKNRVAIIDLHNDARDFPPRNIRGRRCQIFRPWIFAPSKILRPGWDMSRDIARLSRFSAILSRSRALALSGLVQLLDDRDGPLGERGSNAADERGSAGRRSFLGCPVASLVRFRVGARALSLPSIIPVLLAIDGIATGG